MRSASSARSKPSLRARRSKCADVVTAAMNGVVTSETRRLATCSTNSAPKDVSSTTAAAMPMAAAVTTSVMTEARM